MKIDKSLDAVLQTLSEAPETQLDPGIAARLGALQGCDSEIVAHELKVILDECAYGSLASDFAMNVLDHVWNSVKAM